MHDGLKRKKETISKPTYVSTASRLEHLKLFVGNKEINISE